MNKELDEALCAKYPKIFRDRHGDMRKTCMCWGIEVGEGWRNIIDNMCSLIQWHIDETNKHNTRARWNNRKISRAIKNNTVREFAENKYNNYKEPYRSQQIEDFVANPESNLWKYSDKVPQVVATQVKEKFGTLRFYYHGGDDFIDGVVCMACAMTEITCEFCGKPANVRNIRGWYTCMCDDCIKERDEQSAKNVPICSNCHSVPGTCKC